MEGRNRPYTIGSTFTFDDDLLGSLGRPSLTLLIDAYSHCVVGFNLNFNQPSYESVRNALLIAFLKRLCKNKSID